MPNHIHFVLFLSGAAQSAGASPAATTTDLAAESSVAAPLAGAPSPATPISNMMGKTAGATPAPTLGTVVGVYKSLVSVAWLRFIKANAVAIKGRLWQPNYYERIIRIIRNGAELNRIREYIQYNPTAWLYDLENPACRKDVSHERLWALLEDHEPSRA
jgi:hypothetical protein